MKKQIELTWMALALAAALSWPPLSTRAQGVEIERFELGSGEPGQGGAEPAQVVEDSIYHAPQYLPGSPTAASLWPRVIRVQCQQAGTILRCEGYHWSPAMGRAEYLYFMPVPTGSAATPAR